jgi:hypothetical protein
MRELIERFGYRFQLWQRERYGDYAPADPKCQNPLRYVAFAALALTIMDVAAPLVFHRAMDVMEIVQIPVAILFLVLYQLRSRWAWHVVAAWIPFGFFAYWILRSSGYSRYQPRPHEPSVVFTAVFHAALCAGLFLWVIRARTRYFRYLQDERPNQSLQPTAGRFDE